MLHVLLHLAEAAEPITSDAMAAAMDSNPVVARRLMSGLRDAGIVRSSKGHGGGWTLAARPEDVTLRAVYAALGEPPLFAFGNRNESPACLVEQAVNAALDRAMAKAEQLLLAEMESVTLAGLGTDVLARLSALGVDRSAAPLMRC